MTILHNTKHPQKKHWYVEMSYHQKLQSFSNEIEKKDVYKSYSKSTLINEIREKLQS